jgi:hypothetical protein
VPVRIGARERRWESPTANKLTDVAVALRESIENLGWRFERERGEKIYSRFAVILPMPKVAYIFRFRVLSPLENVTFDAWEMRFTHRGDITFLAVDGFTFDDLDTVRQLLDELVGRLPRRPWDFPLGQRLEAGLLIPEWSQGRRMWQQWGFDVGERTPKDWVPKGSLGERQDSKPRVGPDEVEVVPSEGDGGLVRDEED